MHTYTLSENSTADDLLPVAMCLHELLNHLPITARSRNKPGIRIEEGRIIDREYTGPILEAVLHSHTAMKVTPHTGPYKGVPVIVAPVKDDTDKAIGVIGVVDITGIFDLATLMEHQSLILKQVCGKDPCPLPQELVSGKR